MGYTINVKKVGEYIEYLKKYKKSLENNLASLEKDLKKAHNHWDDNNYTVTIEAKDKFAKEQKKLIESIDKSIKKLTQMYQEYDKYLRRK